MPVMSVDGDYYQVRIKYILHQQVCYNVINFVSRGSQDLIENLLVPVLNCVTTHLLPVLSSELQVVGADVKTLKGSTQLEAEETLETGGIGGATGGGLPSTNAAVISLKSTHPGRSGRGRMFIPGIAESTQANSQVDVVFIAAALAFLACMFEAFHDSDPLATPLFHWVVFSKKDDTGYAIESYTPRNIVGTIRSRKVAAI
jgi:hypothetical protein